MFVVVDAVTVEPVSSKQFPANREKYMEVDQHGPLWATPMFEESLCDGRFSAKFPKQQNRESGEP